VNVAAATEDEEDQMLGNLQAHVLPSQWLSSIIPALITGIVLDRGKKDEPYEREFSYRCLSP
jgi:hypothetical protein